MGKRLPNHRQNCLPLIAGAITMSEMGYYADLQHKSFLVTGASSGIGRAIAIALSKQGARVILTGRDRERLHRTCQFIGDEAEFIEADLTSLEDRSRLIDALPELDGICHAAGIISPLPVRYVDHQQFDKVFSINATAPILLTSKCLRLQKLRRDASIVFISSIGSDHNMKGGSVYSSSKAALEAFSRNITLEHASSRIRANCLKPALVKTPLYDQAKQHAAAAGALENHQSYEARYPLGLGSPEDVAAAALFLFSSASRWITGTTLVMDGGFTSSL